MWIWRSTFLQTLAADMEIQGFKPITDPAELDRLGAVGRDLVFNWRDLARVEVRDGRAGLQTAIVFARTMKDAPVRRRQQVSDDVRDAMAAALAVTASRIFNVADPHFGGFDSYRDDEGTT